MRKSLLTVGLLALAIGLLWIGQGIGVIAWPASSFMIRQPPWAWCGAALAGLGVILIWRSRRSRLVMAGHVPAIHVFLLEFCEKTDVDARHKAAQGRA